MSGFYSTIEVSGGGGGGGGALEVISANTYSGASEASITISDIPQTYAGLKLVASLKTDQATYGGTLGLRINSIGASSTAYTTSNLEGYAATTTTTETNGGDEWRILRGTQGTSANDTSLVEVTIMRYAESLNVHGMMYQCGAKRAAADWGVSVGYGSVIASAAITQLVLTAYSGNNFTDGSYVLYGLKSS